MINGDNMKLKKTKDDVNEKKLKEKNDVNAENKGFSVSEVIILFIIALILGFSIGSLIRSNVIISSKGKIISDKYLNEFIKNYEYIIDNYYEEVDKDDLIKNAISGMMNSLDDPYSVYFDESESSNFNITLDGSYKGIGVQISKEKETGYMVVISVLENSPASRADLKAGDKIIELDGESVKDLSISEFSSSVRNSSAKSFDLTVLREDEQFSLTLVKDEIVLSSVASKTYERNAKKIGYIYIGIFASNTSSQFEEELKKLESENISALIIDVRSNTGGHLTSVDGILELFLNSSQIKYQFEKKEKVTPVYAKGNESKSYPVILLGNEYSASASEVLIAGLCENIDATFIGKKTYGKGTVQELVTLDKNTQYKITTKKWLTPKGNWINDTKGIEPDIEVDLGDDYQNTKSDEDDHQLQKALEYIESLK